MQEIYRQYLSGKSLGGIADFLFENHIPSYYSKDVLSGYFVCEDCGGEEYGNCSKLLGWPDIHLTVRLNSVSYEISI